MNLFIKIIFIVFILCLQNLFSQGCKAKLIITCDIENVNILIDDKPVSSANTFQTELELGTYKIVVLENSDRWDAKTFIDTIKIIKCDEIRLSYKFRLKVLLNSDPPDAGVFQSDSLLGYTPLFIPYGLNDLNLKKDSYETKAIDYTDVGFKNPVKLNFIGEVKEEKFVKGTLFKILAGSMIVLGAVTAYYKIEADDSFEEYEFSGDPDLLDRTERFDLISGITFAAFQINFGAIIYYILAD